MATRYILETEIEKSIKNAYSTAKTNDYLLNGRRSKESDIENKVRNGTKVITKKQAQTILHLVETLAADEAYKKIASKLDINCDESPRVLKELDRQGYLNYNKENRKYSLTQKGRILRNGHAKKHGNKR